MKTMYYSLIAGLFLLVSCEEKVLGPIDGSHGKPGVVTEVQAISMPGGADISYRIPNSEDLLAIKAVYTITNGTKREASAFYYDNHLVLEGFADTLLHEAQLYAVNRALELSDPVTVSFKPLESPLSKTIKSVKIEPGFGGAVFSWANWDLATLTFEILTPDSNGTMQTASIFASVQDTVNYIIHGYAAAPRRFALVISDNFGNSSDRIDSLITPLHEEKLDKKLMKIGHLDNDSRMDGWGFLDENLIDDDIATIGHSRPGNYPLTYTIDLGKKVKLSRVVVHNRAPEYFTWGNPKSFEVWINNIEPISQSGTWTEWDQIATLTLVKPSGLPGAESTAADNRAAARGLSVDFPRDMPPTRYVRFRHPTNSTWQSSVTTLNIAELTFFGMDNE
ncbi:hypothetical protein SAMD00024442_50_19 [Candidatus Symbiothrix dinenymphae]|nr:hypothetical protein SAMD00024442_50_19 [Candidatus Symbiothrix dinenymphae]